MLSVDEALLARLLENLMNNSVRHNPKPVNITVHTRQVGERFCLTVQMTVLAIRLPFWWH